MKYELTPNGLQKTDNGQSNEAQDRDAANRLETDKTDALENSFQANRLKQRQGIQSQMDAAAGAPAALQAAQGNELQLQRRRSAQAMAEQRQLMANGAGGGVGAIARQGAADAAANEGGVLAKYAANIQAAKQQAAQAQQEGYGEFAKMDKEQQTEGAAQLTAAQNDIQGLLDKENNSWTSNDDIAAIDKKAQMHANTLPAAQRQQYLDWYANERKKIYG